MAAKELNNTILRNSTNLMAYYRFEAGALTTDDSGNGNTLTNTNTVGEGTGVFGGAADFGSANTNKFLSLGSNLSIGGNGQLSVSFWAKMNTEITTGIQVFFIHNSTLGANRYMQFFYDYNAGSRRFLWDCSGANITKTVALGTTWHHFAMTRPDGDGAVFQAYFDGGCVGTASIGTSPLTRNDVFIGAQTSGANFAASILMDDVAIFNKVLSADEIKELYEGRYIGEFPAEGTAQKIYTNELNSTLLKNSEYLKGYWRFEETSGVTAVDSSGNSHDGTASRTNILNNASGKFGNMGVFAAASSDEILITDHNDMKPTGAFSVGAWIKTTTTAAQQTILSSYSQNINMAGFVFRVSATTGLLTFFSGKNSGTGGSDYGIVSSTVSVGDNAWHYVIGTWDTAKLSIYIDGVFSNSIAWANAPVYAATNYVRVGCRNNTGTNLEFFNGSLDDVFLLNGKALSLDEIEMLYKIRGGMLGLWHLNGNSTDFSGSGFNGTDTAITYSNANGKFSQGAYTTTSGTNGIACGTSSTLDVTTGNATWMFWVKPAATTTSSTFLCRGQYQYDGWYMNFDASSRPEFASSQAGAAQIVVSTSTLSTGNWYHLAFVKNGTTVSIYINGSEGGYTGSQTIINPKTSTRSFYILRYDLANYSLNGAMDDVVIWNRALTAAEIRHYYAWAKGKYL